ncbi:TylF/MycF/NovP-related O-methyltransferase [Spirochaeta cellobiosiphila]|uniref:TylF/MycF/NovP-related O-methyltransferase n=1 Tax=Spirochaeta cellobiosiphila TaxID=504483 RepID=UPI00041D8EE6|nr:TylF/MycF/NovP-related O-methyltransferase [Spirochaeta cellobiosiphila]
MRKKITQWAINILQKQGYGILDPQQYQSDMESSFTPLWAQIQNHTLTSKERAYALYKGIEYLCKANIPGDFVECGVFRGGSSLLAALTLLQHQDTSRQLWMYDTFEGMTPPTSEDKIAFTGQSVSDRYKPDWWAAGEPQVRDLLYTSSYPKDKMKFIKGPVEETLLQSIPSQIGMLRLDTDWYQSTKIELELLYPRLVVGGILIIDDYGHFTGARQAVDEYFQGKMYLSRVDYTGRVLIKGSDMPIHK